MADSTATDTKMFSADSLNAYSGLMSTVAVGLLLYIVIKKKA